MGLWFSLFAQGDIGGFAVIKILGKLLFGGGC